MTPLKIMLIAGEPSGDQLAAELVTALRAELATRFPDRPVEFIGAGGPKMAAAGVALRLDLTQHSVIGLIEVLRHYRQFKRIFDDLLAFALQQQPDVVIGVDYGGFNLRFAKALKAAGSRAKLVQFVSPQVWASRAGRAKTIAETHDLLLSIFPFEKAWYAKRHPNLKVEFVGHPAADRFAGNDSEFGVQSSEFDVAPSVKRILLLPGSRPSELKRHLPPVLSAAKRLRDQIKCDVSMVLPNEGLLAFAMPFIKAADCTLEIQTGGLADELRSATVAIASTGTVTMECAYFGVPTVALYKTSWSTYQIGKRIVTVKHLAMPNILADEIVFPEFIQDAATPENLAAATLELLNNPRRREAVQTTLRRIVQSLGEPGAARRAAHAVADLL
jgi:lipid-A-disaccharide synthase